MECEPVQVVICLFEADHDLQKLEALGYGGPGYGGMDGSNPASFIKLLGYPRPHHPMASAVKLLLKATKFFQQAVPSGPILYEDVESQLFSGSQACGLLMK